MEEQEYRETYSALNERRCVFEKTINSRRSTCERSHRFHLADRDGVACTSAADNVLCSDLLDHLRSNARFALHQTSASGPLPHAREIKVQTGGMLGLQAAVFPEKAEYPDVENIIGIIGKALLDYQGLEKLPYDLIAQAIVKFEGRPRPSPGRKR